MTSSLDKQFKKVNQFNRTYNIGDKVKIRFTPSVITECTVKAPATMLGDRGVVWLKEINCFHSIEYVVY